MRESTGQRLTAETGRLIATVLLLVPFIWMLVTSLKYPKDIATATWFFTPNIENFVEIFGDQYQMGPNFRNTLIVSTLTTLLTLTIGSLAAYSLSQGKWHRRVQGSVMAWLVYVTILPPIALVPAYFVLAHNSGLYDTRTALVLVYTVLNLPLVIWLVKGHFDTIPLELSEAALVDGAGQWLTFRRIYLPLAVPSVASAALLCFVFASNEFLLSLTLTSTPDSKTVPVGIASFVQEYGVAFGPMTAAAALAFIPVFILAVFAQRRLVAGLSAGAVKE